MDGARIWIAGMEFFWNGYGYPYTGSYHILIIYYDIYSYILLHTYVNHLTFTFVIIREVYSGLNSEIYVVLWVIAINICIAFRTQGDNMYSIK